MQSSFIQNYASDIWNYPQVIILKSEKVTYDNRQGQFYLPNVSPMENGDPLDRKIPSNPGNLVNSGDNLGLTSITTSNFVTLTIPRHLFYIEKIQTKPNASFDEGHYTKCNPQHTIIYNEFKKEQKFIAIAIGGSQFNMRIIGVVEE